MEQPIHNMTEIQKDVAKYKTKSNEFSFIFDSLDEEREKGISMKLSQKDLQLKINNINYPAVIDLYNAICISFPKLTKLSDKRKKTIRARFNQGYTIEDFKRLFEMAESSSFLKGGNGRNWSANFDWLITDANMAKVLDGNYLDRRKDAEEEKDVQSESSVRLW